MSKPRHLLYFNGLERTEVGLPEKALSSYLKLRGVRIVYAQVDWHSSRPFQELFDEHTSKAKQLLDQYGQLDMAGASAGGSLGVNIFQRLRATDQDLALSLVCLSGWLQTTDRQRLDYTAFQRPNRQPSEAFRDSVLYCNDVAIPGLTYNDKTHVLTTYPTDDETVPLEAMTIPGVESRHVRGRNHLEGILVGAVQLPTLQPESKFTNS